MLPLRLLACAVSCSSRNISMRNRRANCGTTLTFKVSDMEQSMKLTGSRMLFWPRTVEHPRLRLYSSFRGVGFERVGMRTRQERRNFRSSTGSITLSSKVKKESIGVMHTLDWVRQLERAVVKEPQQQNRDKGRTRGHIDNFSYAAPPVKLSKFIVISSWRNAAVTIVWVFSLWRGSSG